MRKPLIFAFLLALALSPALRAQRGCCSSHGGVCGCRCCDGTPLSDRCSCGPSFPQAPSELAATAPSSTRCILNWIDNSRDEFSFHIESRGGSQRSFQEIGSVGPNVTTATILDLTPSTTYTFRVRAQNSSGFSSYSVQRTVTTPATSICDGPTLCFAGNRFRIEAQWKTKDGASGTATVVPLTDDSGYLWFFNASNVEAVFKVLNACGYNNRFWFFAGGLTDVETKFTVTDTLMGVQKTYTNPLNTPFKPIQDTAAFATCP